jgi:hypothetical protein
MKSLSISLLLGVGLSLNLFNIAQATKDGEQSYSNFLIDRNKPYAFLEVDHVGPRKPFRDGEPNLGIWLRLKNNSKLPITVLAVGKQPTSAEEGLILEDEIVPNPQASGNGEDARMTGIVAPSGLKDAQDLLDIFRWPNRTEEEVRSAEGRSKTSTKPVERPHGYGSQDGFDSFKLILVASGEHVYFSVPANHVSSTWHFEIPFRLAVPNNSPTRPPYSYLAFYQEDLDQAQGKAAAPTTH